MSHVSILLRSLEHSADLMLNFACITQRVIETFSVGCVQRITIVTIPVIHQ